ncbi:MAG: RtcB family protein [Defluviitaleaceae bacterium]|nr:RtcB family protein [Defluviitaleaceae bacterium]
MLEIQGQYSTAKIFTDNVEQKAISQIYNLLNQGFVSGSKIRIMPDVHAGMGSTVGTTITISNQIAPNLVGVDIGCGIETAVLRDEDVDLQQLDMAIHQYIPSGLRIRKDTHRLGVGFDLKALRCAKHIDIKRALFSIGTLGGGNHFIELGRDDTGLLYLVVHSGSRNLGKQMADFYLDAANKYIGRVGRGSEKFMAYLEGELLDDYLHDMNIVQKYAELNRNVIIKELEKRVKFKISEQFTTIHNYIDIDTMILRKGAISAQKGERVIIPMNMRDGSIICIGKGNEDWNCSAPHGAGRLLSRGTAKESYTLAQYEEAMEGIFSSSVNKRTLDEAPFAYKPMDEIIARIGETVDIIKTVKPVYNFKAGQ